MNLIKRLTTYVDHDSLKLFVVWRTFDRDIVLEVEKFRKYWVPLNPITSQDVPMQLFSTLYLKCVAIFHSKENETSAS